MKESRLWVVAAGAAAVAFLAVIAVLGVDGTGTVYATPEETATASTGATQTVVALTPTATSTPTATATATPNNGCVLDLDKSQLKEGSTVIYTIEVNNHGTTDCADVEVTDVLDEDLAYVSSAIELGDGTVDFDDDDTVTCTFDDNLEAGDTFACSITVETVGDPGSVVPNQACATATGELEECSNLVRVVIEENPATETPTPVSTATSLPTSTSVPSTATRVPTAVPTVRTTIPNAGTGSSGGGLSLLALLGGVAAIVTLGGAAFAVKRMR